MSSSDTPERSPEAEGVPGGNDLSTLQRARGIFFDVRELGPARRDEEIDRR